MSEIFDDAPAAVPPRPGNRSRALVITAVVVVVAFLLFTAFAGLYTDMLWYDDLGFGSVFTRLFWTRAGLFVGFGGLMALIVGINMLIAFRNRPFFHPADESSGLERYRSAIAPVRGWLFLAVSLVVGLFAGTAASGAWRTYMLWRNGVPFGQTDSYFGRDIGFYVFDLPWWHFVVNFTIASLVMALLLSIAVHYLYGGIRLQVPGDRFSPAAQVQLSALLAALLLVKAIDYWLDRYDMVHNSSDLLTGIGYTEDHAVVPAKLILAAIAIICAGLFLFNIWQRTWTLPSVGLVLMVVSSILLGLVWPGIVQYFQVRPSLLDKQESYVAEHIDATRTAYAIDDDHVEFANYTAEADPEIDVDTLDDELASVPLVDPQQVAAAFEKLQISRLYYDVGPVLDVDHYELDGKDRALVLGVRELNQDGVDQQERNWTNLHTVYTHGNGVIAAYANQRNIDDVRESADIQWAQGSDPGQNDLVEAGPGDFEQRIYFGEQSPDYSVVGREEGATPVELDLDEEEGATTYDGEGGVSIGSTFKQLMYAVKFGSANFLLSDRVNSNSEVLYNRDPKERVEKVAPWLVVDSDTYPVVVDGRVLWVLDGYTTTNNYPGSRRESFADMTDDALQTDDDLNTLPTDEINYMRNAVKATVDAYDGTVTLYEWDDSDPILRAWESAFPGTVQPRSAIPDDLMSHLRYPEDLFKVQRYQLARYHVTDTADYTSGNNRWAVPTDPNDDSHLQAPYRLYLDESGEEIWSLTSTFVPQGRSNLASFVSVDADATSADYGKITVLERPDEQTKGPGQVNNLFRNDQEIADALARFTLSGATPIYGNLLTIPTDDGFVYIEPVYAARATGDGSYPTLAFVLVSYNEDSVGFGTTLREALADVLGQEFTGATEGNNDGGGDGGGGNNGGGNGGTSAEQALKLLAQADRLFVQADVAAANQDYAERERLIKEAQDKVARAFDLLGSDAAPVGDAGASTTTSTSAGG